ncbi:MAG: hypothetical protein RI884_2234 [Pseudomonadota bacterium]|jgi:hypothetical protein
MPDLRLPGKDFFTRGIDRIVGQSADLPASLPDRSTLPPTEHVARSSLDLVLAASRFEDTIDQALRPLNHDRDLLRPGEFGRALAGARSLLLKQPASQVLDRAIELLDEEQVLRDLAHHYRSALYPA